MCWADTLTRARRSSCRRAARSWPTTCGSAPRPSEERGRYSLGRPRAADGGQGGRAPCRAAAPHTHQAMHPAAAYDAVQQRPPARCGGVARCRTRSPNGCFKKRTRTELQDRSPGLISRADLQIDIAQPLRASRDRTSPDIPTESCTKRRRSPTRELRTPLHQDASTPQLAPAPVTPSPASSLPLHRI